MSSDNNMQNFGIFLKEHREKKGIRLEEIASITKIHIHSLELMEQGKWDSLPPEPFIRGFIIAYAKYVGVEPREAIRLWTEEQVESENLRSPETASESPKQAPPPPLAEKHKHGEEKPDAVLSQDPTLPLGKIAMAFGCLMLVGVVLWLMSLGKSSVPTVAMAPQADTSTEAAAGIANPEAISAAATNTTPEVKKETVGEELARIGMKQDENRKVAAANPAAQTTAPAPVDGHEIVVEPKERTWAKVVVDNEAPMEFFLSGGEKATYRAKDKIKLVLGNSTGTKVTHNGAESDGKKFQGTIRSYIFPNNARFPQDVKPKTDETENANTNDAASGGAF
jgi:cytoskeleton protein RodZ